MSGLVALGILLGVLGLLWMVRKAGRDSARRKAAEEALRDIQDANRPVGLEELERLRRKYQRD